MPVQGLPDPPRGPAYRPSVAQRRAVPVVLALNVRAEVARAKLFVHFTSWGISHVLIGALKATSMHVPVYGFVSNVESGARVELTEYPDEAPKLKSQ